MSALAAGLVGPQPAPGGFMTPNGPVDPGLGDLPGAMGPTGPPLDPTGMGIPGQPSMPTPQIEPLDSTPEQPNPQDLIKGKILDWQGGLPIKLSQKMDSGKTLEEELSAHLKETLDLELQNQKKLIDKIKKWNANYKGIRPEKKYPYDGTANTASSMTRSDSDAIYVRCYESLTNKRRYALLTPKGVATEEQKAYVKTLEVAFDHYLRNVLHYKQKIRPAISQSVKTGTGVIKVVYEQDTKTVYRYAKPEELGDDSVDKFKLPGTKDLAVKEKIEVFKGPNIYPVPRERFIISSDAESIDDAYMVGFEFNLRKPELKVRGKKPKIGDPIYISKNVEKILNYTSGKKLEENPVSKQDHDFKGLDTKKTEYESPIILHELWLKYDVDEDGEEDDIVVVFHNESGTILKATYNPIFYGYRPFVAYIGNPNDYMFDGEGVCEILESTQDEVDALHNLRLDRLAQINLPIVLVRAGFRIDDFKLTPGKTWVIDEDLEQAIKIVPFPDVYHSTFEEEDRLKSDGDRAVGVTPNVLGQSTAERPVAKETMVNLEEANKKFQNWTTNYRNCTINLFYLLFECFAQHQPEYTYVDQAGQKQVVEMPMGNIRDLIEIDVEVSSEQMSLEVRREKDIVKYQMLSDYMTKLAGMVQALTDPSITSDFKKFLVEVVGIGNRAINDVMESFDERAPEEVVPNLDKIMDVNALIARSVDLMQPPPPPNGAPGESGGPSEQGPPAQSGPPGQSGESGGPPQPQPGA